MSDLISRQSVIDLLKKSADRDIEEVVITEKHIKIIEDMPCAYDVEKVVEELNTFSLNTEHHCNEMLRNNRCDDFSDCDYCKLQKAVAIVKAGGVE